MLLFRISLHTGSDPIVTGPSSTVIGVMSFVGVFSFVVIVIGIVAVCVVVSRKSVSRNSARAPQGQTIPTNVYEPPALVSGQQGHAGVANPPYLPYPPNAPLQMFPGNSSVTYTTNPPPVMTSTIPQPNAATDHGLETSNPPAYPQLHYASAPEMPTTLPQPTAATGGGLATADPPTYQELQSPSTAQSGQESSYQELGKAEGEHSYQGLS